MSENAQVGQIRQQRHELFGRIVEEHVGIPRQVMRRYKSVPSETSITEFLTDLRTSLRQGSLARIRFVRSNRPSVAQLLDGGPDGASQQLMTRAQSLLDLSRAEAVGMVLMANHTRHIRHRLSPIEQEFIGWRSRKNSGQAEDQRERGHTLALAFESEFNSVLSEFSKQSPKQTETDPYRGTAKLTDYFDLSTATIESVMPASGGRDVVDQMSRFVSGVLEPRVTKILKELRSADVADD